MNEQIKKGLLEGRIILFLGAGASLGSINQNKEDPPLGNALAKKIADQCGWEYQNEALGTVYSAAKDVIGWQLNDLLVREYKFCSPSKEYLTIAKFPWARIYTTNIDDALENAFDEHSKQKLNIKQRFNHIEDKDQIFARLDYIYLNGSVKFPDNGYVFSPEEYGKTNASSPQWYEELASDFLQSTFIFIGTELNEPVFYHQVERYKERAGISAPLSYLITPKATPIQIASLKSYGIQHMAAELSDFCNWLNSEFDHIPTPLDIAKNKFPELRVVLESGSRDGQDIVGILKDVILVSRESLNRINRTNELGTIRKFYKGYKPTWDDILEGIPARLEQYDSFLDWLINTDFSCYALIGPAGSGKATMLQMAALELSDKGERAYYIPSKCVDIGKIIEELEKINANNFYVFIERLDSIKDELVKLIKDLNKAKIVSCDGKNVWHNRIESKFSNKNVGTYFIDNISENDVKPILDKIQKYGPWTRLARMSERERHRELFDRSKRQLLIGLMETTTGIGFEQIIQKEYASIASEDDRFFFVLVCLATMHRCSLSSSVAARALINYGVKGSPISIAAKLKGIIENDISSFSARHSIYARTIIESIVDKDLISNAILSILAAFHVYKHPIVKNLNKNDSDLFKSIINHRFLVDILRSDELLIERIYNGQEKYFENEGLFWLQYGLFKRDFKRNIDAHEILLTAYNAFPHDHTVHALAQQKLILSSSNSLSKEQARKYMCEAVELLEKLDHFLESDDTYPIVTMAEGHVASLIALDGSTNAKVKAKEYMDKIEKRIGNNGPQRLRDCKGKLMKFVATGKWSDTV